MSDQGRGRGRARTWPEAGRVAVRRPVPWFISWTGLRPPLVRWIAQDIAPGRLVPWLPVAFAFGIMAYFAAPREPALWAAVSLAGTALVVAVVMHRRPVALPVALGFFAASAGFATATLRSAWVDHPVLWHTASSVEVTGFVAQREERERSDRMVVEIVHIEGRALRDAPRRIRVSVRRATAPPVGSYVTFRARLASPLAPLRPGGYDFARDLWFQGIGATGFVLGRIRTLEAQASPPRAIRYAAAVAALREGIDARIRAVVPGDAGAIASALITGKRDAISATVNEAMYVSSLAHVLSISGYHMAVVAGVVFFAIRGLLALVPALVFRFPIKKWAAGAAILAAAFYLLVSGAEVATQRAFIMTAVVLGGVLIDRAALTLRTLAMAALAVLALSPQALVHPSFQMSFAATLALVAVYERSRPWMTSASDTPLGARIALWGGRHVVTLVVASTVAGLATTLFAAYHFHRVAPYGVLANLVAMPVVSLVAMPAGLLALVAIPFGFDAPLWRVMGEGIGAMIAIALWVAALPGAVGRIAAFGIGPFLLGAGGLTLLCLLRSRLRWLGGFALVAATALAVTTPQPDLYVSPSGDAVGVRGANGRLSIMRTGSDTFAVRTWLSADGDGRAQSDPSLRAGPRCDGVGCAAHLADGTIVALALDPAAFADDCSRAALIVTRRTPPAECAALVVDRNWLQRSGALAVHRVADGWKIVPARSPGDQRPWMLPLADKPSAGRSSERPTTSATPPDAAPRQDDLEPGD